MYAKRMMEKMMRKQKKMNQGTSNTNDFKEDVKALESDWYAVGDDFKTVLFGHKNNTQNK